MEKQGNKKNDNQFWKIITKNNKWSKNSKESVSTSIINEYLLELLFLHSLTIAIQYLPNNGQNEWEFKWTHIES